MDLMLQEGGRFGPHGSGSSLQDLTKDLEAKSGLKAAAVGAGAQMLQLGGGDETPGPAQSRLLTQLTQVELDWARLLVDVPAVQTALQEVRTPPPLSRSPPPHYRGPALGSPSWSPQRWLRVVGQQGALQDLRTWVDSAETRLEDLLSRTRSSTTALGQQLEDCRVKPRSK